MIIDYINKQGLSAAIEKLRTLCMTKADGVAIYEMIALLADAVVFPAVGITIPTTGWQASASGQYTVSLDIPAEITADDGVDIVLSAEGLQVANDCGLCPTVETLPGALRFLAISAPGSSMTGEYRVLRGASSQQEG